MNSTSIFSKEEQELISCDDSEFEDKITEYIKNHPNMNKFPVHTWFETYRAVNSSISDKVIEGALGRMMR